MMALHDAPLDHEAMDDKAPYMHSEDADAIPVRLVGTPERTRSQAPEHASWTTYVFTGTEAPVRILSFDKKRARAWIMVQVNGAPAGTQYVRLAKTEQVAAASGGNSGGLVAAGLSFEYKAAPDVWAVPQAVNGAIIITILEERNTE